MIMTNEVVQTSFPRRESIRSTKTLDHFLKVIREERNLSTSCASVVDPLGTAPTLSSTLANIPTFSAPASASRAVTPTRRSSITVRAASAKPVRHVKDNTIAHSPNGTSDHYANTVSADDESFVRSMKRIRHREEWPRIKFARIEQGKKEAHSQTYLAHESWRG